MESPFNMFSGICEQHGQVNLFPVQFLPIRRFNFRSFHEIPF